MEQARNCQLILGPSVVFFEVVGKVFRQEPAIHAKILVLEHAEDDDLHLNVHAAYEKHDVDDNLGIVVVFPEPLPNCPNSNFCRFIAWVAVLPGGDARECLKQIVEH